jgi:hypothetical protein
MIAIPLAPPVCIPLLSYLFYSGMFKEVEWLHFTLAMSLAIGSFAGMFVGAPFLAVAAFVFLLVGVTQRIARLRLLAASLLLTAFTLAGSVYWFWHYAA